MARSRTSFTKGQPTLNPKGRPPGPTLPTLILRDALVLAAQRAGGDGPEGLVNYLQGVATTHPAAFMPVLARVLPLQIEARGSGHVTIEIIKRFGDEPGATAKLINGHANGNGHKDPAAE